MGGRKKEKSMNEQIRRLKFSSEMWVTLGDNIIKLFLLHCFLPLYSTARFKPLNMWSVYECFTSWATSGSFLSTVFFAALLSPSFRRQWDSYPSTYDMLCHNCWHYSIVFLLCCFLLVSGSSEMQTFEHRISRWVLYQQCSICWPCWTTFFTVLFSHSAEHQLYSKPQSVDTSRETSFNCTAFFRFIVQLYSNPWPYDQYMSALPAVLHLGHFLNYFLLRCSPLMSGSSEIQPLEHVMCCDTIAGIAL